MQGNSHLQCSVKTATAIVSKIQNQKNRRKARWKLKFHHQALPAEYLNHYEASLQGAKITRTQATHPLILPKPSLNGESLQAHPPMATAEQPSLLSPIVGSSLSSWSQSSPNTQSPVQCTVRYDDLPYMGEMTLDNARPRRGRKPKKADICHLIYKNYGTTILDEPLNLCLRDLKSRTNSDIVADTETYNHKNRNNSNNNNFNINSASSNNSTANNQVSMCKFKFTAGVVPSLKEKKSMSVNTGTDIKLISNSQHSHNDHHNDNNNIYDSKIGNSNRDLKRKTRKSLAREKLEKTFKEKGFLIQTQQLESAQGATYCKFRQLRKFTRYLFRSWKNHLPGDIANNNAIV